MVHNEGFVYIRAGQVTIYPIPVARIAVYNGADDNTKAKMVLICLNINLYNDIKKSKGRTIH